MENFKPQVLRRHVIEKQARACILSCLSYALLHASPCVTDLTKENTSPLTQLFLLKLYPTDKLSQELNVGLHGNNEIQTLKPPPCPARIENYQPTSGQGGDAARGGVGSTVCTDRKSCSHIRCKQRLVGRRHSLLPLLLGNNSEPTEASQGTQSPVGSWACSGGGDLCISPRNLLHYWKILTTGMYYF